MAGSPRSISKIGIGQGTVAPTTTDVALASELLKKVIQNVDQSGETSLPPSRICVTLFDPTEANGSGTAYIREVGFFFDNDAMAPHALFGQKAITGATQANPIVVNSNSHGLAAGATIYIQSVDGMTQLNNNHYTVANPTTNTFELGESMVRDIPPTRAAGSGRASSVPSPQKIVPSPRKFTDPLCDVQEPSERSRHTCGTSLESSML